MIAAHSSGCSRLGASATEGETREDSGREGGGHAVACASACGLFASSAAAVDVYSYANGCYTLHDATTDRFVVRGRPALCGDRLDRGRRHTLPPAGHRPGQLPALRPRRRNAERRAGRPGRRPRPRPGRAADWRFTAVGARAATDERLHRTAPRRGRFEPPDPDAHDHSPVDLRAGPGLRDVPRGRGERQGTAAKGARPSARVRGFVDTHTHVSAFQFLGGRFHCGKPWSPYGVTVALVDCVDHGPDGAAAVAEVFLSGGTPGDTHSPQGWPGFTGWPRDESLTHEGTYWKWLERAWRSGLRIMVNDLVENRALCELYPLKQNNCNEMASAYQQANDMYALQDYIDAQFGGPGKGFLRIVKTPLEARRVVNSGKLAMVLGVEISEVLNCGQTLDLPHCTETTIDRRARPARVGRGALLLPDPQVRQRARRREVRRWHDRHPREHGQQVRDRQVLDGRALRGPGPRQPAGRPDAGTRAHVLAVPRPGAHAAAVRGTAADLSEPADLQPEGAHRPGRVRDPADDGPRHDHRDRPHEHDGAPPDDGDARGGELRRRHLEPQLGRPRQPEAHPGARRPDRADLLRVGRASPRSGVRSSKTGARTTSSESASAPTSTACTRSRTTGRTRRRTPCSTRSFRSTARA